MRCYIKRLVKLSSIIMLHRDSIYRKVLYKKGDRIMTCVIMIHRYSIRRCYTRGLVGFWLLS